MKIPHNEYLFWYKTCTYKFIQCLISSLIDNEDPVIHSCPANQTINTVPSQSTAIAVWTDLQATDNSGIKTTITCDLESGNQVHIGQTEVVCEARDPSGNQAICTFVIEVIGK